jgi:hypothetical protein
MQISETGPFLQRPIKKETLYQGFFQNPKEPIYHLVKRAYLDDLSKKQYAPSELPIKSFEFKSLKNATSQGDNVYWKY